MQSVHSDATPAEQSRVVQGKHSCLLINLLLILREGASGFFLINFCLFKHFFPVSRRCRSRESNLYNIIGVNILKKSLIENT